MSEEQENKTGASTQGAEEGNMERGFGLLRVYLKDVSFESPNVPEIFQSEWNPEFNINIGTRARSIGQDQYEVVLSLRSEAKQDDKIAYLAELHHAGVFVARGFSDQERGRLLGVLSPEILLGFAREALANLVMKGGFPQMLLQPVNFEQLYQQSLQQKQQQQQKDES